MNPWKTARIVALILAMPLVGKIMLLFQIAVVSSLAWLTFATGNLLFLAIGALHVLLIIALTWRFIKKFPELREYYNS